MSVVKVQGNASGTGIFTIAAPNSNTDRTLTLPDNTGTILTTGTAGVPVNGPAFSAVKSASQSVSAATWTKLTFPVEEFDTNNCFDSATNYRFTPIVAGYYQISGCAWLGGVASQRVAVWKNGAAFKAGQVTASGGGYNNSTVVSALVYLNGSTDYVELYAYASGSATVDQSTADTYFQAFLARAA